MGLRPETGGGLDEPARAQGRQAHERKERGKDCSREGAGTRGGAAHRGSARTLRRGRWRGLGRRATAAVRRAMRATVGAGGAADAETGGDAGATGAGAPSIQRSPRSAPGSGRVSESLSTLSEGAGGDAVGGSRTTGGGGTAPTSVGVALGRVQRRGRKRAVHHGRRDVGQRRFDCRVDGRWHGGLGIRHYRIHDRIDHRIDDLDDRVHDGVDHRLDRTDHRVHRRDPPRRRRDRPRRRPGPPPARPERRRG